MIITWFWLSTASAHFACLLTWHTTLSYRSLCNQIYSHGKTFTEPNQTWTPFNFPTSKRSAGTGSNFWIAWFFSPSFVCSKASKPGRLFWLSWRWLQNCRKKEKKKQKVRKQKFGERIHQTAHQMVIQTLERQGLSYPKVSKMFTKKTRYHCWSFVVSLTNAQLKWLKTSGNNLHPAKESVYPGPDVCWIGELLVCGKVYISGQCHQLGASPALSIAILIPRFPLPLANFILRFLLKQIRLGWV